MFKLQPDPVFPFTAHISVPGVPAAQPLRLIGRHMGRQALAAFDASLVRVVPTTNPDGSPGVPRTEPADLTDLQVITQLVAGWEEGQVDAPFSTEALGKLLDEYPNAAREIHRDWRTELLAAREKN